MRKMPKDRTISQRLLLKAAALAVAVAALGAGSGQAAIALSPSAAAGQWDLTLADTSRSCRMTLRSGPDGATVSMPAGCRRSLPILANVGSFEVPKADHLALDDQTGKPVLDFAAGGGPNFVANGPQGETYQLVAISGVYAQAGRAEPSAPRTPGFQTVETKTAENTAMPNRITSAIKSGDMGGRYAVLREAHDTGCMITLDDHTRAPKGGFKATLAPACRDQGIVIFDPMAWQLAGGRLVLTARKGHSTHLDLQQDQIWLKDPKEGKSLGLKKIQ